MYERCDGSEYELDGSDCGYDGSGSELDGSLLDGSDCDGSLLDGRNALTIVAATSIDAAVFTNCEFGS